MRNDSFLSTNDIFLSLYDVLCAVVVCCGVLCRGVRIRTHIYIKRVFVRNVHNVALLPYCRLYLRQ